MQRARATPVAWLGSGSCQNRPKGWILINQWFFQYRNVFFLLNTSFEKVIDTQFSAGAICWKFPETPVQYLIAVQFVDLLRNFVKQAQCKTPNEVGHHLNSTIRSWWVFLTLSCGVDINSSTFYKCTATFWTHCILLSRGTEARYPVFQ
jgi:hypothetical protein